MQTPKHPSPTKLTKAQKKKARQKTLAEQISHGLNPIGVAQFVESRAAPPAKKAEMLLQDGRYHEFVSVKEAWLLHLLKHIMSGVSHIVPPSPCVSISAELAEPFKWLGYTADSTLVPGTYSYGAKYQEGNFLYNGVPRPLLDSTQVNYLPVEGRAFATIPMTGNQHLFVWVDPYDWDRPLKVNQGPNRSAIQGSLRTVGAYDGTLNNAFMSMAFEWANGYDPRMVPTEWVNVDGQVSNTGNGWKNTQIYPPIHDLYEGTNGDPVMFRATNVVEWICDCEIVVSVANPTAFSATAMRARTKDTSAHRWSERCDRPASGDYGFTGPFITSNLAEARWRGCSWTVPIAHRRGIGEAPAGTIVDYSEVNGYAVGFGNVTLDPLGIANWYSLQECLSEMVPLIEIQQNTDTSERSVDLNIEIRVKKCLVPVMMTSSSLSTDHLTFPARLPRWYHSLSYEASVAPVNASVRTSSVPYAIPLTQQMNTSAVRALHSDVSSKHAIQLLAAHAPPVSGNVVGKEHRSILDKISRVGSIANEVVHQAADTANTGYGIGKGLLRVGKELWNGLKWIGGAAKKALPLIEEVGLAV